MLKYLRDLLSALRQLVSAMNFVAQALNRNNDGRVAARVEELERSRSLWEGEMEGQLVKLTAKFNAARSVEERTKKMVSDLPEEGDADAISELPYPAEFVERYRAHAGTGEVEEVPALREVLDNGSGHSGEIAAKARKWGR